MARVPAFRWMAVALSIALIAGAPGRGGASAEDADADGFPGSRDPAEPGGAVLGVPPGSLLIDRSHGGGIGLVGITVILEDLYGWTVDELVSPPGSITPSVLAPYDVLLVPTNISPGPGIIPYTDDEVAAIVNFVAQGGGLWAFHEYSAIPDGINSLSTHFGVTFYNDIIEDPDADTPVWPEITNLVPHPITEGVESYTYFAGPCLTAVEPAAVLGTADDNAASANCPEGTFPPVLAVYENDAGGCAVFHGDITILTGIYIGLPEGLLVENMIRHLASGGPIAVETRSWGAVKAVYR